jgi:carboxyl-terminal processing protease
VIYLPKFYIDFENKDGRDAGKDIALEVERLKAANVDGMCLMFVMEEVLYQLLLISLDFIEKVPIVQIKSAGRKKRGFV